MKDQKGITLIALVITVIIVIVVVIGAIFIIRGTQNGGNSGNSGNNGNSGNDNYSAEQLLDFYAKGLEQSDYQMVLRMYPASLRDFVANEVYGDEERFKKSCDKVKEEYGSDFKVTINTANKREATQEMIEKLQQALNKNDINVNIEKGYIYDATMTFTGSKKTNTTNSSELWYCLVDGEWGFIPA